MIALAMVYAACVGVACATGAWLAEWAATLAGRSARWAWGVALVLSVVLPADALWRAWRTPAPAADASVERVRIALPGASGAVARVPADGLVAWRRALTTLLPRTMAAPVAWAALDRVLLAAWAAFALAVIVRMCVAAVRTRRVARDWSTREILGARVCVSRNTGPAAVGVWRPEVVIPAWALDDARLPLMLAHEREHLRAHDPLLIAAGTVAAALVPWSPAAWWQLARLRAAVEVDCDRRVLAHQIAAAAAVRARDADAVVRSYGGLLLDVAARPCAGAPVLTLGGTPTLLRRRINAMLSPRPRSPWRATLPAGAAAVALAVACEVPRPTGPAPLTRPPIASTTSADGAVAPAPDQQTSVEAVRAVIASRLPALLTTPTGHRQRVWVVQRADGSVDHILSTDDSNARNFKFAGGRAQMSVDDSSTALRVKAEVIGAANEMDAARAASNAEVPAAIAAINRARIGTLEVLRIPPGRVTPDSLTVVWMRLRAENAPAAPGGATQLNASADAGSGRVTLEVGTDGVPRSITSSALDEPVVIVDGREVAGMSAIPAPARIARVDIFKGAGVVREYGERAALGGVVRVTTKADAPPR